MIGWDLISLSTSAMHGIMSRDLSSLDHVHAFDLQP